MTPPPDANAFALSQRNFDGIPPANRNAWFEAFRAAKTKAIPMPERLILELANTCNLDCPMCRVGAHGIHLERVMPLETFQWLASELFSQVREVRLNGLGETTLIPEFERYLDVLERYPVVVELITNGTGSPKIYQRILDHQGTLLFSWDAATPARFELLRRPASFVDVSRTVREVANYAASHILSKNLHFLFTLQPTNIKELAPVVQLAAELGVPNVVVNLVKLRNNQWLEAHTQDILTAFHAAEDRAAATHTRLFLPDHVGRHPVQTASAMPTSASGCDRPWKEVVIRWDLDVQVCNMFNPYTYGNLHLRPFRDIWQGAFAQAFRQTLHSPACHPYCVGCAYIGEVYARKQA